MSGLSLDLLERCHFVLGKCWQFDNEVNLRAVFSVRGLHPFRDGLPKYTGRLDAIHTTVAYLLDQTTSTQPVLPEFILALRPADSEDELYNELEQLYQQIIDELGISNVSDSRIKIPYVVAAMRNDEVAEFKNGTHLDTFKEFNPSDLPPGWEKHYHTERDQWRLHSDPDEPIAKIIENILLEGKAVGKSYSKEFFDPSTRGQVWLDLQNSTGIVVIDAISLFYPPIFEAVKDTGLASGARMAVLVFSPVFHKLKFTHTVREMLETTIAKDTASICLQDYCSGTYEISAWNLYGVQRWLYTTMPAIVENVRSHNRTANIDAWFGPHPKRNGIHNTMYSGGGG